MNEKQNDEQSQEAQAAGSELKGSVRPPDVFFTHCPECGFDTHATREEAIAAAEGHLDHYRDDAGDGWSEDVTGICWGEIKQEVCETERRPRTDEDMCDPSFEEVVDYGLRGAI